METNLTSYGGGSYKSDSEKLHAAMFKLHHAIYQKGSEHLKGALRALHAIETSNADLRPVCKRYILEIEELRDQLESVGRNAANVRSMLIKENGCNGECNGLSE